MTCAATASPVREMIAMRINDKLERKVAAVGGFSRQELTDGWVKTYGCQPPRGVKRALLERSVAWHLQAKRLGGLSREAKTILQLARGAKSAAHVSSKKLVDHAASSPNNGPTLRASSYTFVKKPRLRPGARLLRDWNGRTHAVDVIEDGFVFDGKTYKSLSAVARRITGVRWSGPRFFGL